MRHRTSTASTALGAALLLLTGCGAAHHQATGPAGQGRVATDAIAPAQQPAGTARVASAPARAMLDGAGHAVVIEAANVVQLSSNAGQSWSSLRLPAPPAAGQSIAAAGNTVAALTVDSHGMALQRTSNAGQSWQARPVPLAIPTDQADLAISADGSRVAVLASVPGSANDGATPELLVGTTTGSLVTRAAPASGSVAWVGSRLLLAGGPLSSRLYASDDNGASWVARPVGGPVAPRFNLDPNTPSIGQPLVTGTGSVLLPVTVHRADGSASVRFYRSSDGVSFTPDVQVVLSSRLGSGTSAVVSTAGPSGYLVAEPGSTLLHLVSAAGSQRIQPAGLPGPVDSLSFIDAQHGLAQVTVRSCSGSKQNCASQTHVLRSSDGGHSWTDTTSAG